MMYSVVSGTFCALLQADLAYGSGERLCVVPLLFVCEVPGPEQRCLENRKLFDIKLTIKFFFFIKSLPVRRQSVWECERAYLGSDASRQPR